MSKGKYVLKPGKVVYFRGNHYHQNPEWPEATFLTDELAARAIKEFPGILKEFESVPEAKAAPAGGQKKQIGKSKAKAAPAKDAKKTGGSAKSKPAPAKGLKEGTLEWYKTKLAEAGVKFGDSATLEALKEKYESLPNE